MENASFNFVLTLDAYLKNGHVVTFSPNKSLCRIIEILWDKKELVLLDQRGKLFLSHFSNISL